MLTRLVSFVYVKIKSLFLRSLSISSQIEYSKVSRKAKVWSNCKVFYSSIGDYSYVVGTNIEHFYPLCVEKGRGEVKPINAPFLQWQNLDGSWVRTHYSRPAKPRPFVKPTYETIKSEAIDIVKEEIYDATIG